MRGDHCSIELLVHRGIVAFRSIHANFNMSGQVFKNSNSMLGFVLIRISFGSSWDIPLSSSPSIINHYSRNPSEVLLNRTKNHVRGWIRHEYCQFMLRYSSDLLFGELSNSHHCICLISIPDQIFRSKRKNKGLM